LHWQCREPKDQRGAMFLGLVTSTGGGGQVSQCSAPETLLKPMEGARGGKAAERKMTGKGETVSPERWWW
jgi:hypothetical protein